MSQDTLDILHTHRTAQVELSPFSETFQIVGGDTFRGWFDRAHLEDKEDKGHITQKKLTPLIGVAEVPAGLVERSSEITRENGTDTYTLRFIGKDDEGIPILWLF